MLVLYLKITEAMDNFDTLNHNVDTFNAAVTHGFWDVIFAHPMLYIGYIFAFVAAIAFLTFLRGFLSGFSDMVKMDFHEEHQEHYRVYATWGVTMLIYLLIVWEIIRSVTGFFV